MNLKYQLMQVSPIVCFSLFVFSLGFLSVFLTYFFRKYKPIKFLNGHNEVTGYTFLSVSTFYSLLLGFVVYLIWNQYYTVRLNADMEGGIAKTLYRTIKFYPDKNVSEKLKKHFLVYIDNIVHKNILR